MSAVRTLRNAAIWLAVLWLIGCIAMIVFARTFIYPYQQGFLASQAVGVPGASASRLQAEDGTTLIVWTVQPRPDKPVVLYFMGNGGSLPGSGPRLAELAHRGYGIAALNYRGAGGAPGQPSQDALTSDALRLYDHLDGLMGRPIPAADRILYGSSLGAAIAVQLAARRPSAAVILETPFNRMCEVAEVHFPIFPACVLLPYEKWDSASLIGQIEAPILILHGDADSTIPVAQGRALYDAAPEPKRLIVYPGGRHNDLRLHGAGQEMIDFIETEIRR